MLRDFNYNKVEGFQSYWRLQQRLQHWQHNNNVMHFLHVSTSQKAFKQLSCNRLVTMLLPAPATLGIVCTHEVDINTAKQQAAI